MMIGTDMLPRAPKVEIREQDDYQRSDDRLQYYARLSVMFL